MMRFPNYLLLCKPLFITKFQSSQIPYSHFRHNRSFKILFESHRLPVSSKGNCAKLHLSAQHNVKSFQEKENEYAHYVMEKLPTYSSTIVKQPLHVNTADPTGTPEELAEFEKNSGQYAESESEDCLLFVYGTLKINEPNYDQMTNSALGKATFHSFGRTVQKWPLIIASRFNIPFLLYKENVGKNVVGELFKVDKKMLHHMDEFESHPTYYTRIQVPVELLEDETGINNSTPKVVMPWVYFLKQFRPELLEKSHLENYHSKDCHGLEFITRYGRARVQDYYSDVKNDDTTCPEDIYK